MQRDTAKTDIGGPCEAFQTTHWSEIYRAGTTDDGRRNIIISALLDRYWKPVYCYLRRKGYDNERSKDLTQGFFHEIVLNSSLLHRADSEKGRFRTFLLTALNCYVNDEHRKKNARRRAPRGTIVSMDDYDMALTSKPPKDLSPENTFNYAWATELLDRVISLVKGECRSADREVHWCLFRDRILAPIFQNSVSPSIGQLCEKHGIQDQSRASNMIVTVKRCFKRILDQQLKLSLESGSDIEQEYNDLLQFLGRGAG